MNLCTLVGCSNHWLSGRLRASKVVLTWFKLGTYDGTSYREFLQRLVPCSVYTMGLVAGTRPLKVYTRGL